MICFAFGKEFKIDFTSETHYKINKQGILMPVCDNDEKYQCRECGEEFENEDFEEKS